MACSEAYIAGAVGQHGVQHRLGGRHARGVAGIHAAVEKLALGDEIHDRAGVAESGDRVSAAQRLGDHRDVGSDEVVFRGPAGRHAEPGDHLVEDQQHVVAQRGLADALQESGLRGNQPRVAHDRLHDHRGNLAGVALQAGFQRVEVVPGKQENIRRRAVHALRPRQHGAIAVPRQLVQRGVITMEHRVAPAVVVPLEQHDLAAAR